MHKVIVGLLLVLGLLIPAAQAQESVDAPLLPRAYAMQGGSFEYQGWNNCGPATLTNALSFFGYSENQTRAANWLKPNGEDKNVSPWQMVEFVNTQVQELNVFALERAGGTVDLLKRLVANDFPVIIEAGYDPEPDRLGWMGHYLLVTGYDDSVNVFITQDSYLGANLNYDYDYIDNFWQHFNYTYIVLYRAEQEIALLNLLGSDADERENTLNALEIAREQAITDNDDAFAWFNMGTNFVSLGMYPEAAQAYDMARNIGLPWRMMWYQFGPYEAYNEVGRYDDMVALAQTALNDGGGQFVEETYYYGGLAREGRGEFDRALSNYNAALQFNPNFTPALNARSNLQATLANA